jgi:GAF domain-containing protein
MSAETRSLRGLERSSDVPPLTGESFKLKMHGPTHFMSKKQSMIGVPLMRKGEPIGVIGLSRNRVAPFAQREIDLVTTFANQAVIAIENARLLSELRQRTADLSYRTAELTQALEQQTATAEVLQVISRSPGDLEPVFASMLENAVRICDASFGAMQLREDERHFRRVALHNAPPQFLKFHERAPVISIADAAALRRIVTEKRAVQQADLQAEEPGTPLAKHAGARTLLVVPLLKQQDVIGAFGIYRQKVRSFTDDQIALVQNFAAQAVTRACSTNCANPLKSRRRPRTCFA